MSDAAPESLPGESIAESLGEAAEAFFRRAALRLAYSPAAEVSDDLALNPDFRRPAGFRFIDAAVLIPVLAHPERPSVLLTVRTAHLAHHAGQVAFPGGRVDAGDPSPVATALREAEEEIGLARTDVEIVGCLAPYFTATGFRVVPVLARVAPACRIAANPAEVAEVFEVPLGVLMAPENHRRVSREIAGAPRSYYEIPFGRHHIWGATAGMIRALYERVYC